MSEPQEATSAQDVLFTNVYLPTFVEKCAAQGLQLPDQDSIQSALESVTMLKAANAAETNNMAKAANDALRSALKLPDPKATAAAADKATQQKQASVDLSQDAKVRQALDTLAKA